MIAKMAGWHWLLLGLGLLPCGSVQAGRRMLSVVGGIGVGADKAAALVGYYVRQNLQADERFELLELSRALGNQDRDKALKAFEQAEDLLQKGREAYETLELDAAVAALTQALSKYEHFPAYVLDMHKVAETLMLLGATHILRGENQLGQQCLQQALTIFPKIEPDPRIFNPGMRNLFQTTLAQQQKKPLSDLWLTSTPSAAEVYVDNVFQGVTPWQATKLLAGRHWVRLEKDGWRAWGKVSDLLGNANNNDTAQLRPTMHLNDFETALREVLKQLPNAAHAAMHKLGELSSADVLFVVQVRLDGEKVQLIAQQYDVNAAQVLLQQSHSFNYDSQMATYQREVQTLLHSNTAAPQVAAAADSPAPEANTNDQAGLMHAGQAKCLGDLSCAAFKSTVVGLTCGVSGVLLSVGVIEWFLAKHDYNQFESLPQVSSLAANLATNGQRYALQGDIFFSVGAIGMATGLALLTWWQPTPPAAAFVPPQSSFYLHPQPHGFVLGQRGVF